LSRSTGRVEWEVTSANSSAGKHTNFHTHTQIVAVTAMHFYDMTGSGGVDLIIGRDDGQIEIYTIDDQNAIELFQTFVGYMCI
jgi:hypothetical protein